MYLVIDFFFNRKYLSLSNGAYTPGKQNLPEAKQQQIFGVAKSTPTAAKVPAKTSKYSADSESIHFEAASLTKPHVNLPN